MSHKWLDINFMAHNLYIASTILTVHVMQWVTLFT